MLNKRKSELNKQKTKKQQLNNEGKYFVYFLFFIF